LGLFNGLIWLFSFSDWLSSFFHNQTVSWNTSINDLIIKSFDTSTQSFDNKWHCYVKTFTKRLLTNQTVEQTRLKPLTQPTWQPPPPHPFSYQPPVQPRLLVFLVCVVIVLCNLVCLVHPQSFSWEHRVEIYTWSHTSLGWTKEKIRLFFVSKFPVSDFRGISSSVVFITSFFIFFKHVRLVSCWVHPMLSVNATCASAFSLLASQEPSCHHNMCLYEDLNHTWKWTLLIH
jgi:hypothetical protein